MDVDLSSVEMVFAQKLACGEPVTRQRAFRVLQDWIKEKSSVKPFTEADMLRLCKGLHYVMWMQDKMLLQEELADRIGQLLSVFSSEDERVLFILCTFKSLGKEWNHIDRWRMDKFLMLMRRILRVLFTHLSTIKWKKSIRDAYWNAFNQTTISAVMFLYAFVFHFASLILDEMDNIGGITKKQITACLKPFADLLGKRSISDYLFNSIATEIFATILHQKSEELASKTEAGADTHNESTTGIQFDYCAIAQLLFNIGKKPGTISKRRRKLYNLVKKFHVAAKGGDPYHFKPPVPRFVLTRKDYEEAEMKLMEMHEETVQERKRMKLEKLVVSSAWLSSR
ncbi:unnamed protein product [Angiostrongylus costaricensis]|uniref:Ras-GEF domain-containing protein n=1 Tax=Angiostrongylus costaricensis TaxID=334426 RepID=A0A0R3PTK3_ANGCS|nr:unnamed protein product [Angiostrongylus costaricensis]